MMAAAGAIQAGISILFYFVLLLASGRTEWHDNWVDMKYTPPRPAGSYADQLTRNQFLRRNYTPHRPLTTEEEKQRGLFLQGLRHIPAANVQPTKYIGDSSAGIDGRQGANGSRPFTQGSWQSSTFMGEVGVNLFGKPSGTADGRYPTSQAQPFADHNRLFSNTLVNHQAPQAEQAPSIQLPPHHLFPLPSSPSGIPQAFSGTRQLGRYNTGLSRFSAGPADESMRARVVIDPGNVALPPGAGGMYSPGLYGGYVSHMEPAASAFAAGGPLPVPPQPSSATPLSVLGGIVVPERGSKYSADQSPAADRLVAERAAADQLLREIPSSSNVRFFGSPTAEPSTVPTAPPFSTNSPVDNNGFTTYPNYGTEVKRLFPALDTHGKEDLRPATGRRLGPQGRFGGGTNEYREDLGRTTFGAGINSRLQSEWDQMPGRQVMPNRRLNELAPNARLENYPLPPYESIYAESARAVQAMNNNLVRSDPFANKQFFRTSTPPTSFDQMQSTTAVGVPVSRVANPASPFINTARSFNPANPGDKFTVEDSLVRSATAEGRLPAVSALQPGAIQPYYGPEELTRSRFRQQDEWMNAQAGHNQGRGRNRFVNMAVTNECSMC